MKRQIVLGLLFFMVFPYGFVFADIDQKQQEMQRRAQKMEQLKKKKKSVEQEGRNYFDQIEKKKKELHTLEQKEYEWQEKVDRGEKEMDRLKRKLAKSEEIFEKRVRVIYLRGKTFYVEQLVRSPSLVHFLHRLDQIQQMIKRDRDLVQQYEKDCERLISVQKEWKSDLVHLQQQRVQATQRYEELQREYKQQQRKLSQYQSQLEELEEENEAMRKEVAMWIANSMQGRDKSSVSLAAGPWRWPADGGKLTSSFGRRYHPIRHQYRFHEGIDISVSMGTAIRTAASGEVIEARPSNGYGYVIVIYHGNGLSTLYAHMYARTVKVKKGQKVGKGKVIAAVGNNGWATGPHLHFEVHRNGKAVNPMNFYR